MGWDMAFGGKDIAEVRQSLLENGAASGCKNAWALIATSELEDAAAVLDRRFQDLHRAEVDFAEFPPCGVADLHPLLADDHHVAEPEDEVVDAVPVPRRLVGFVVITRVRRGRLRRLAR